MSLIFFAREVKIYDEKYKSNSSNVDNIAHNKRLSRCRSLSGKLTIWNSIRHMRCSLISSSKWWTEMLKLFVNLMKPTSEISLLGFTFWSTPCKLSRLQISIPRVAAWLKLPNMHDGNGQYFNFLLYLLKIFRPCL